MTNKLENDKKSQNHREQTEQEILKKIKEYLNPIQENLAEKKITIDEAKSELKKINERIQGSKLEKKEKKEIGKAFEKLINLEKNIDENTLKNEVNEIINLLKSLTRKDLTNLLNDIQQHNQRNHERPIEVQEGIDIASSNLTSTVHEASQDQNPIARTIGKRMENLMA